MKFLYLCSQNKRRSLTAEKVLNNKYGHEVRSAGTENNSRIKVTEGMLGWADVIITMEKKHTSKIKGKYAEVIAYKPIICLNILDEYLYMDTFLIELLEDSFEDIINS